VTRPAPNSAVLRIKRRSKAREYRVRYEIDEDAGLVRVLDIDHRRDAYRH